MLLITNVVDSDDVTHVAQDSLFAGVGGCVESLDNNLAPLTVD